MRKTLDSFLDGFIQSTFSSSHYCKEKKEGTPTGKCISLNISKKLPHFRGFGCRILKEKIDSSEECLVSRTRSIYKDCEGISPFPSIYQHQHKETREELPRALPVLRNVFLPFSLTSWQGGEKALPQVWLDYQPLSLTHISTIFLLTINVKSIWSLFCNWYKYLIR